MNRREVGWLTGLMLWDVAIGAQERPELAEGDRLLLETTQILGVVAGSTDRLSTVSQYLQQRQLVQDYFEKAYPGQTVDWSVIPAVLKAK